MNISISRTWVAAVGFAALIAPAAHAQAVAFFPGVQAFPNGAVLSATPVVSYDRRYVRLSMNPQFTALEGFTTFQVPAAVTGGGGGGLGGGGGVGGMLGFAGMNGPIAGPGTGSATPGEFGQGMDHGRSASAAGFSTDFEDQVWPQAQPSRKAPARGVAKTKTKAKTVRPTRTVQQFEAPKAAKRGPIKVKRSK
jgi:hypothetical protein